MRNSFTVSSAACVSKVRFPALMGTRSDKDTSAVIRSRSSRARRVSGGQAPASSPGRPPRYQHFNRAVPLPLGQQFQASVSRNCSAGLPGLPGIADQQERVAHLALGLRGPPLSEQATGQRQLDPQRQGGGDHARADRRISGAVPRRRRTGPAPRWPGQGCAAHECGGRSPARDVVLTIEASCYSASAQRFCSRIAFASCACSPAYPVQLTQHPNPPATTSRCRPRPPRGHRARSRAVSRAAGRGPRGPQGRSRARARWR